MGLGSYFTSCILSPNYFYYRLSPSLPLWGIYLLLTTYFWFSRPGPLPHSSPFRPTASADHFALARFIWTTFWLARLFTRRCRAGLSILSVMTAQLTSDLQLKLNSPSRKTKNGASTNAVYQAIATILIRTTYPELDYRQEPVLASRIPHAQ
jgi:hypothetical protein